MKTTSFTYTLRSQINARYDIRIIDLRALLSGLCLALLALVFAFNADAHPRKEAETEITYNANADRVEIIHRYRIHDSEEVLHRLHDDSSLSIMTDLEAQALFGDYISQRFSMARNGAQIPLELVGGEIEDGFIWIYQIAPPLPEDGLYVLRSSELMDVHPEQTNIVHVRLFDRDQTFIFTRSTPWATFNLDGSSTF